MVVNVNDPDNYARERKKCYCSYCGEYKEYPHDKCPCRMEQDTMMKYPFKKGGIIVDDKPQGGFGDMDEAVAAMKKKRPVTVNIQNYTDDTPIRPLVTWPFIVLVIVIAFITSVATSHIFEKLGW